MFTSMQYIIIIQNNMGRIILINLVYSYLIEGYCYESLVNLIIYAHELSVLLIIR